MEHFLQIKILHGVATVLLFGGLLGLAFYAWRSWRTATRRGSRAVSSGSA